MTLQSWGRYPRYQQTAYPLHWREDIADRLNECKKSQQTTLAFGNGRSYGDSCLAASDRVLPLRSLDRFIQVDWQQGIIIAEAGVTLAEILALAIPQGWFLPVTPGTKYVTLGGAIANDVHGKNHHVRGTFGNHVRRFGLHRSDRGELCCSLTENTDLFAATVGGLGLSGVITWVELQLMPIQSSEIQVTQIRFEVLNDFFDLSKELDVKNEYSVAWIDCLSKKGRGIFSAGNHAHEGRLQPTQQRQRSIPFTPPVSLVNALTLKLFNQLYYQSTESNRIQKRIDYDTYFYPLDGLLSWNKLYGLKGFQQFQCVIPEEYAKESIHEMLDVIANAGQGSFLAVLKRCGAVKSPGLLSFPLPGISLALDFPNNKKLEKTFKKLDALVREAHGRLYPAKDAHMTGVDFRQAYPQWELIEKQRDPVLLSRFWQRVTQT